VSDPEDGQVGFFGTVLENGMPDLMALRLKVDYGNNSEIRTIIARSPTMGSSPIPPAGATSEEKGKPRPQFLQKGDGMPRADLVRVASAYFTGLAGNTGRNTASFWPSCNR
jgi:hypothetical protein